MPIEMDILMAHYFLDFTMSMLDCLALLVIGKSFVFVEMLF